MLEQRNSKDIIQEICKSLRQ